MKHALITGGAGFIGLHLARRLVAGGCRVDLVDDFRRGQRDADLEQLLEAGARLIEADLTGPVPSLTQSYAYIIHLAAHVGVAKVLDQPLAVLRDNALMLMAVLQLAREQPALERLVFASTSEVYAGTLEHGDLPIPTPEDVPLVLPGLDRPRSSYMLSKLYGEALVQHAGVPFTIVRPHNVYGPRMGREHVIPQLLERAHATPAGGELEVYSVDHTRTFCYVDDAVALIHALIREERAVGGVFNIGVSGPEVTIGELARHVIDAVGKPLTIVPRAATEGSPTRRCPDLSKLERVVGERPTVGLVEGIARTHAWYGDHVYGAAPSGRRA